MKIMQEFFFSCLINGTSMAGLMILVFALIGFSQTIIDSVSIGNNWLFNDKMFALFIAVGLLSGIIKSIVNVLSLEWSKIIQNRFRKHLGQY